MVAPAIAFQPYSKLYIVLRQQTDKLEFGELTTHTVILSEARSAKSKNLRTYQLHCTKQVRRSFDSLHSLRMTTGVQIVICLTVRLICVFLCF